MNPLFVAACEVQAILEEEHFPFCIIGGLAVIRWGEIRVTQDVDLTVLGELGLERELIDRIVVRLRPRIEDAKAFASRDRDWADISGVIARQGDILDWRYIEVQLEELCAIRNDTLTVPRLLQLRKATGGKTLRKRIK